MPRSSRSLLPAWVIFQETNYCTNHGAAQLRGKEMGGTYCSIPRCMAERAYGDMPLRSPFISGRLSNIQNVSGCPWDSNNKLNMDSAGAWMRVLIKWYGIKRRSLPKLQEIIKTPKKRKKVKEEKWKLGIHTIMCMNPCVGRDTGKSWKHNQSFKKCSSQNYEKYDML